MQRNFAPIECVSSTKTAEITTIFAGVISEKFGFMFCNLRRLIPNNIRGIYMFESFRCLGYETAHVSQNLRAYYVFKCAGICIFYRY